MTTDIALKTIAGSAGELKTITPAKLAIISERMVEIDRATNTAGKTNTQTTSTLMTLTMLREGPFGAIRQILAQIEKKKNALRDAYFKNEKLRIKIKRLRDTEDSLDHIKADEKSAQIEASRLYIEGSLKEIGMYQQLYTEIREAHGICEDWDEADMEQAEIENHIKQAFKQAHRDVLNHGTIGLGNCEYLEQYGIHLITATQIIRDYVNECTALMTQTPPQMPSIEHLYDWLDKCAEQFKAAYKLPLARLGVGEIIKRDWLYLENSNE